MPLLLIPLALLAIVLAWLLLMPLALWQRYRRGHARRRAVPWAIAVNAWLLLASVLLFVLTAWLSGFWIVGAVRHAGLGLAVGIALGIVGLWLTRFERDARGLHFSPNRWLVLALTLVVAARIGYGLWHAWQLWQADAGHAAWLAQQANLLAVGGLLLGYYLAYAWGLRHRLAQASVA